MKLGPRTFQWASLVLNIRSVAEARAALSRAMLFSALAGFRSVLISLMVSPKGWFEGLGGLIQLIQLRLASKVMGTAERARDMGQLVLAISASSTNLSVASAATAPTITRWIESILNPPSFFERETSALHLSSWGGVPALLRANATAML